MITAGPASGTASWSTKKMPVPTVAPTPNIVSWKVPKLRFRSGPACGPFCARIGLRRLSCSPSGMGRGVRSVVAHGRAPLTLQADRTAGAGRALSPRCGAAVSSSHSFTLPSTPATSWTSLPIASWLCLNVSV